MEQLWVRDLDDEFGDEWVYREATPEEILAAAANLDGAEPDYEAALSAARGGLHFDGMQLVHAIVDAALAGRKLIPLSDKETPK